MAIPYPDYFTTFDCRLVEEAIAEAEPPAGVWRRGRPLVVIGPVRHLRARVRGSFESDTAAIAAVLQIVETVVRVWQRHPEHANDRAPLEAILDWLVADWADPRRPAPGSELNVFSAAVRDELQAHAWWPSSREMLPDLAPTSPSSDTRPPLSVKNAAKRLGISPKTLRRRSENGKITTFQIGGRGPLKVAQSEVERLLTLPSYQFRK